MTARVSTPIGQAHADGAPAFVRSLPGAVVYSDVELQTAGMRRTIVTTVVGRDAPRVEVLTSRNGVSAGSIFVHADSVPVLAEAIIVATSRGIGSGISGRLELVVGGSIVIGFKRRHDGAGAVTLQRISPDGEGRKVTQLQGAELVGLDRAVDVVIDFIANNPRHAT